MSNITSTCKNDFISCKITVNTKSAAFPLLPLSDVHFYFQPPFAETLSGSQSQHFGLKSSIKRLRPGDRDAKT